MKINKIWLKKKEACLDAYEKFCNTYTGWVPVEKVIEDVIELDRLDWANWLIVRCMEYKQCITYAIFAAEQVIDIYEKEYPNDKTQRKTIEEAKIRLKNPTKKNKDDDVYKCYTAVYNIYTAVYNTDAATYAAYAAADAYAAAYAADAHAHAHAHAYAYAAAYAAACAAYVDAYVNTNTTVYVAAYAAACAAANAVKRKIMLKILNHGLELIKQGGAE